MVGLNHSTEYFTLLLCLVSAITIAVKVPVPLLLPAMFLIFTDDWFQCLIIFIFLTCQPGCWNHLQNVSERSVPETNIIVPGTDIIESDRRSAFDSGLMK